MKNHLILYIKIIVCVCVCVRARVWLKYCRYGVYHHHINRISKYFFNLLDKLILLLRCMEYTYIFLICLCICLLVCLSIGYLKSMTKRDEAMVMMILSKLYPLHFYDCLHRSETLCYQRLTIL